MSEADKAKLTQWAAMQKITAYLNRLTGAYQLAGFAVYDAIEESIATAKEAGVLS